MKSPTIRTSHKQSTIPGNMLINQFTSRLFATVPAIVHAQTLSHTFGRKLRLSDWCGDLGNHISPPTKQQKVEFHPLTKNGTSGEIFTNFRRDKGVKVELKQLAVTTAQFCAVKSSLRGNDIALIKDEVGERLRFFVAFVKSCNDDDFIDYVHIRELTEGGLWRADNRYCVMVAQPEPAES